MKRLLSVLLCLCLPLAAVAGGGSHYPLMHMRPDFHDKASLQRGAKLYMNYCAGCHSLQYMRYNRMGRDIGIVDAKGKVAKQVIEKNLIFTGAKVFEPLTIAMDGSDAREWFGVTPPDLSLMARVRGVNWLYTYLLSFYQDTSKQFGTNNALFPDVAMPNVLLNLQGAYKPIFKEVTINVGGKPKVIKEIARLKMVSHGQMDSPAFHQAVYDLVNFLSYVGEPMKATRQCIGYWVLGFLIIFIILSYLLKKAYWKDVK